METICYDKNYQSERNSNSGSILMLDKQFSFGFLLDFK